ncbi:MAG: SDR family NAD(P)-dependent oxidoreductase [Terriglobales bacterium]
MKNVLIVGGAGFVGSHTADALLRRGHAVRIYDNLSDQVHRGEVPAYLSPEAELIEGDVRDLEALSQAVQGADVIYQFAAAVGVGQSMYRIADYTASNVLGTANLLQAILNIKSTTPEKIIVASSMSIYGEGRYLCSDCGEVAPRARTSARLKQKQWEVQCPICNANVSPAPTDEDKPPQCTSIYALSKKTQEEMALLFGSTYNIPTVALRYFNIYGPRQALSNPYTGAAAIFASRLMNGRDPLIFEDGQQLRDFVNVRDVVQANLLAMESSGGDGTALNVGSGKSVSVCEVASKIACLLGAQSPLESTGAYRAGDIRHCYADISKISEALGYVPKVNFHDGMTELVQWLESQEAQDHTEEALKHLAARGLVA